MNLIDTAQKYYKAHREAFENWTHGYISEVWIDENGVLCIRYTDGIFYHYKIVRNELVWY